MYRHVDAALIRAAAYPDGWQIPPPPGPTRDGDEAGLGSQDWRRWLEQVAHEQYLCDAVELASPSLMRAVRDVCADRLTEPKRVRRAGLAMYRYALRLRHRATPFGLFAGVAPVRFGTGTQARRSEDHRACVRPDATWLSTVIDGLEHCPELLRRLPVVADATATVRGDRLIIPFRRAAQDGRTAPAEVSVRHTWPVQVIVAHASAPVSVAKLVDRASVEIGGASRVRIERFVAELVRHGVLRTALRPPMTAPDALGHVLDVLDAVSVHEIADANEAVGATVRTLRDAQAVLRRHVPVSRSPDSPNAPEIWDLAAGMTGFHEVTGQPLAADLRLGCTVRLPDAVTREAAAAADVLGRLTPRPLGSRSWSDYRTRFLDRYGTNALVPVLDLVNPELGLGYPDGYRSAPHTPPERDLSDRDERLLALAQQAAFTHAREISLTGELIDQLCGGEPIAETPHLDVCFRIQAGTPRAVDEGAFTLIVTGVTGTAGATAGRFLHVLDAEDRDRMIAAYAGLPTLSAGARMAQVSSPPFTVRTENVARTPVVHPGVIAIGAHHPGGIRLADLAVIADTDAASGAVRLYLVSRETGTPVEPVLMNAVDLPSFTHPLARFVCELPRAYTAAVVPFQWGAAANLPYLPRIRYGRAVLAPRTWRLIADDLPDPGTGKDVWSDALRTWRSRWAVPAIVEVGDDDRRLRLDLQRAADRVLLRRELDRAGHATLRESAQEETAYGWFGGRPHEITLTLASAQAPRPAPRLDDVPVIDCREHGRLPGTDRRFQARLSSHHLSDIIRRLPELLDGRPAGSGLDEPPVWWFTREPGRLRLSFRLPRPDAYGRLAARVGSWAADLRYRGLLSELRWETSFAEPYGRYGEKPAAALENVFAADSTTVIAQLACTGDTAPDPLALTAAGLIDLVAAFLGGRSAGTRWLIDHGVSRPAPQPDRTIRDQTLRLAQPPAHQALRRIPGGEPITAAWAARRDALAAYRSRLIAEDQHPEPAALAELVDAHLRRTGADRHACRQLARAAALTWNVTEEKPPR